MKTIKPWLDLKSVSGIGNLAYNRLLHIFGSPENVLMAPESKLLQVQGITAAIAAAIRHHHTPDWVFSDIEQVRKRGFQLITLQDDNYPALLLQIPDPPPVLYVYGRLEPQPCPIAVVGSRNASVYGRDTTYQLCKALAERGATVVSGMARGIDTAAHKGALSGGGRTIAVLGSGFNRIYPTENAQLFHQIAENGCAITEFALDAAPEAYHFPLRNRIISGMTLGTVVVEAARKSGSLITARLAAEQNREVFAVPGSIHSATARGTHDLIKQGAKLVENVDDIFEEIAPQLYCGSIGGSGARVPPPLSDRQKALFDVIGAYPVQIDQLVSETHETIGALTGLLLELELKGVICQMPGKRFVRHTDFLD
jgi:DNA processing protein